MLEYEEWGMYDVGHERGYQTGYQTAVLKTSIRFFRVKDKKPSAMETLLEFFEIDLFAEGQMSEFLKFVKRYPHMPPEKLAERIMKESEYIYGMSRDGEF